MNTGKIIAGEAINLCDVSFFKCQSSGELSAPEIYLPYRTDVDLGNCRITGEVFYLDPEYKEVHATTDDRHFEGGKVLVGETDHQDL